MPATEKLFVFVKEHYDVTLEKHDFWSAVAQEVAWHGETLSCLLRSIILLHPKYLRRDPALIELTDPLFLAMMMRGLTNGSIECTGRIAGNGVFSVFTQGGTRDISKKHALQLQKPLKKVLKNGVLAQIEFMSMVQHSERLWDMFKSDFLNIQKSSMHLYESSINFRLVLFRHAPHVLNLQRTEKLEMYNFLCGSAASGSPSLFGLRNILKGPHNNVLAWSTALQALDDTARSMDGNWMHMLSALSSFTVDPQDQEAWKFWHRLHECTKDDASGQELSSYLERHHYTMHDAYTHIWPIVTALAEGDERYVHASQIGLSNPDASIHINFQHFSNTYGNN